MIHLQEVESHTTEAYPGTQAVARAIALLKAFSDTQPEWGLRELAQATGLNKTTAFRLLAALEAERLVMRNPLSGGYRLGVDLIALGGCAMRSNPLRAVSRPVLEDLAQECDESASLEVLIDQLVLIVDEVSSRHPMGMSQDVGSRLPPHATATGKLLLAHRPAADLDSYLSSATGTPDGSDAHRAGSTAPGVRADSVAGFCHGGRRAGAWFRGRRRPGLRP